MKIKKQFYSFIALYFFITTLCGQSKSQRELEQNFYFRDTVVTAIDSVIYDKINYEFKYCKKIEKLNFQLFKSFSDFYRLQQGLYRYHSIKCRTSGIVEMTIIGPGHYHPELFLLTFNEDLKFIGELLLESSFVDAGQVDIYFCRSVENNRFARTYLTEWEKWNQKLTVVDSTVLTFQITDQGKIDSVGTEKFMREVKWR